MNLEIKTKWLAALRSGEYEQGQNYLNSDNQFCCLGVLCDIYGKENDIAWKVSGVGNAMSMHSSRGILPDKVRDWAELVYKDPLVQIPNSETGVPYSENISTLNDSGKTFLQIADFIEAQL